MADVDAAAGRQAPSASLEGEKGNTIPMKKRKMTEELPDSAPQTINIGATDDVKKTRIEVTPSTADTHDCNVDIEGDDSDEGADLHPIKRAPMSKAREIRLEQNRKAARESRRRKKVMIEELQRSVIFFSRANGTLKQQNDELGRLFMQAQSQVAAVENGQQHQSQAQAQANANQEAAKAQADAAHQQQQQHQYTAISSLSQQAQANTVATQALFESQGFPPAAARTAAQTMNATAPTPGALVPHNVSTTTTNPPALPAMQPGATMQAMANFQQAAAAAMQAAMGMNPAVAAHAQHPQGVQAQQAYMDTMNVLMQQQAAAAAAGQQYVMGMVPHMQNMQGIHMMAAPHMTWAPQQQPQPPQNHQQP